MCDCQVHHTIAEVEADLADVRAALDRMDATSAALAAGLAKMDAAEGVLR